MARSFNKIAARVRGCACAGALALATSATAQTAEAAPATGPAGLAEVWRNAGRDLHNQLSAWAVAAFSSDGKLVAVGDETGVRILRAGDGGAVRKLLPGFSDQFVYSLAVSATGHVAIGRVGRVEVHDGDGRRPPVRFECAGACGPVASVAFSPDGSLLAFQGSRVLGDRRRGLGSVDVVDVATGRSVAQLEASAARARVGFSSNGRRLLAANTTSLDEQELFGLRAWNVTSWKVTDDLLGAKRSARSAGALERTQFAAAFERDGNIEIRDLVSDGVVWSAPLVPPAVDSPAAAQPVRLRLVEIAANGRLVLSYEAPPVSGPGGAVLGTIVVRAAADGAVVAMYDVPDVSALAIAPDGKTFLYATGSGQTETVLARVPL